MSESKHTPGSWNWEYHPDFPDKVMALSAADRDVLICTGTEEAAFGIISEADARLIAAAPIGLELAKAVLAIRKKHDVLAETIPDIAQWLNIVQLARRVVEAAEPKGNK